PDVISLIVSLSPRSSSFFFSLIPLPPRSTLFPYTTLFRSRAARDPEEAQQPHHVVDAQGTGVPHVRAQQRDPGRVAARRQPAREDRKSTRLNSSHVSISYAVFCLKKKNTQAYEYITNPRNT